MPNLYGRPYSRSELNARVGRLDAIAGVTPFTRANGIRELVVRTGAGLAFSAIVDRGLDIALATFDDVPLCWSSPNEIAPASAASGFLRSFMGGLVTTCGLANFGPGGTDAWGSFDLHGRIDAIAAESVRSDVRWLDGDIAQIEVSGTIRETEVFGDCFRLERRIRTIVGGKRIELHDEVTNEAGDRRPHMILYHCNGGFPILDDATRLYVSHAGMLPRDAQAAVGLAVWDRGGPPQAGFKEQVFIHDPLACEDGRAVAALWNPTLRDGAGLGLAIRFDPKQLPSLFTWRMLGHGTYVMAMEPANCATIEGRVEAGKRGTLPFLEPGETRTYDLTFEVLASTDELAALITSIPIRRAATA